MKKTVIVIASAATAALTACGSNTAGSSSSTTNSGSALKGRITVLAAASLTESFGTLEKQFEAANPGTTVTVTTGASSALATQIVQGKAADVFASASTKNMKQVIDGGEASTSTDFVKNTLEIAVPPSNPAKITKLADLARSGVKVATCEASVPCGAVAQQVFAKAKLTVKPTASLADVKATLAAVEGGEVDAGLVYVTDVQAAGSKVAGIEIPDSVNASTTYPITTLTEAANKPVADAFVRYVLSPQGQQVLTSAGFSKP